MKLLRKSKIKYFDNLNVKNVRDSKNLWKIVRTNFPVKKSINENISLWEKIDE